MPQSDLFRDFPDHARLWIYPTARPLSSTQEQELLSSLGAFFESWHSHGRRVTAEAALVEGRFLLVAGYVDAGDVSGCGIDASVRALDETARGQGIEWDSPLSIHFRDESGAVSTATRGDFRRLAQSGAVSSDTRTFDTAIMTIADLRAGYFERAASASWHARYFNSDVPAAAS